METTSLWRWGFVACGAAALALWAGTQFSLRPLWPGGAGRAAADTGTPAVHARQTSVAARGRLQPTGGVICVAGPSRPGAVIASLRVHEGDWVESGAVLAKLDGTAAQEALVRRLSVEVQHATTDLRRFEQLYKEGVVSVAERDAARLRDQVARAELAGAQADLDSATVHAPITGRVLIIHTHAGERIGSAGVLDLGNTAQMEVVAEVYETDIAAVRVGQPATVTAAALPAPLAGKVERIGLTIGKLSVFAVDPAADTDARVVEVHIRLDDGERAAALTNLQVDVDLAA
jgi:multidrug efflux pump subunit AcrA (membrane-fusion protein)